MIGMLLRFTGLSPAIALAIAWAVSTLLASGVTGYKAYQFGKNVEIANCNKKVAVVQGQLAAVVKQVDEANAKAKKAVAEWEAAYKRIDAERDASVREAEQQEAELLAKVQAYETEIANMPDNSCKPLDADSIKRLRE